MFSVGGDGLIQVPNEFLGIPEFKAISERDTSKGKVKSNKDFLFVYYVSDYDSPYINERLDLLFGVVSRDLGIEVDEVLVKASDKYKSLQKTSNIRLFNSIEGLKDKMSMYLESIQEVNAENMDMVLKTINTSSVLLQSTSKNKDIVEKGKSSNKVNGGGDVGIFENGF